MSCFFSNQKIAFKKPLKQPPQSSILDSHQEPITSTILSSLLNSEDSLSESSTISTKTDSMDLLKARLVQYSIVNSGCLSVNQKVLCGIRIDVEPTQYKTSIDLVCVFECGEYFSEANWKILRKQFQQFLNVLTPNDRLCIIKIDDSEGTNKQIICPLMKVTKENVIQVFKTTIKQMRKTNEINTTSSGFYKQYNKHQDGLRLAVDVLKRRRLQNVMGSIMFFTNYSKDENDGSAWINARIKKSGLMDDEVVEGQNKSQIIVNVVNLNEEQEGLAYGKDKQQGNQISQQPLDQLQSSQHLDQYNLSCCNYIHVSSLSTLSESLTLAASSLIGCVAKDIVIKVFQNKKTQLIKEFHLPLLSSGMQYHLMFEIDGGPDVVMLKSTLTFNTISKCIRASLNSNILMSEECCNAQPYEWMQLLMVAYCRQLGVNGIKEARLSISQRGDYIQAQEILDICEVVIKKYRNTVSNHPATQLLIQQLDDLKSICKPKRFLAQAFRDIEAMHSGDGISTCPEDFTQTQTGNVMKLYYSTNQKPILSKYSTRIKDSSQESGFYNNPANNQYSTQFSSVSQSSYLSC